MEFFGKIKAKFSEIREKVSAKEFAFICLFSAMFVFNYFIFGQFEVMLRNQADFGISPSEVAWLFVLVAFILMIVIILILSFLCYRFKRVYSYTVATMIGLVLSGYAQVLFLNKVENMAVGGTMMRGSVFDFALNLIINAALVAAPIVLLTYARRKKLDFTSKLSLAIALVIIGMQFVGLMSTIGTVEYPAANNELYYFSVDEQLKLSKNDNVVVFILDRFDTDIADAIFKRHPETEEVFGGFTYYGNNVSEYPGTFPSVTSMLTGKKFDASIVKQKDYMKEAWSEPVLFDALHEKDYKVNGLLDSVATFYDFKDISGHFDNIRKVEPENRKVRKADFYFAMLSFSMVRQSPDLLKWLFANNRYYNIADYCVTIKNTPDYYPKTVSPSADLRFYEKLKETSLSADEAQNVFSFVHLQASHSPYEYNENLEPLGRTVALINLDNTEKAIMQTRGTFKILDEYFSQMKSLGIYDSSTIIVVGDHGIWNNRATKLKQVPTTSLLIKRKGDGAGMGLNKDAISELSNYNFDASVLEIIGSEHLKDGKASYFDVLENGGLQSPRYFFNVRWTNLNACTYLCTYEINGDANKIENWKKID